MKITETFYNGQGFSRYAGGGEFNYGNVNWVLLSEGDRLYKITFQANNPADDEVLDELIRQECNSLKDIASLIGKTSFVRCGIWMDTPENSVKINNGRVFAKKDYKELLVDLYLSYEYCTK